MLLRAVGVLMILIGLIAILAMFITIAGLPLALQAIGAGIAIALLIAGGMWLVMR
jgi:hypothetical protein